jgi:alditol oxidase
MTQTVYQNLPFAALEANPDEIFGAAYSVSLFTDWQHPVFNQVWIKHRLYDGVGVQAEQWHGAARAMIPLHPLESEPAENCTEQMGIAGAWHERLPHFRMDHKPSRGEELQSEYFVPRAVALDALRAVSALGDRIAPLLFITEVRTIAADDFWMSPCYGQDSVGIHFTWKPEWDAVKALLPDIEACLEPFGARPHWGKLFTMQPSRLASLYPNLPHFRELLQLYDPAGKFRNDFLNQCLFAS